MPIDLEFKDLDHFQPLHATDLNYAGAIKNQTVGAEVALFHPLAGRVEFTSIAMPHLQILKMDWQTGAEAVRIHGHEQVTRTIGVSFQTAGYMHTRFNGIKHDLEMKAGRNNLVFTPEPGDAHQFSTNETVGALQMNLDEDFFKSCIGTDDTWVEKTLLNLEAGRPFSAVDNSAETTPQMTQLIDSIVNCKVLGPMRNLLIQSRALELLALQFDQFRVSKVTETIYVADAEKLHALKSFLDQHFLTEFSLTQLSRKFLINEFKLKKGFKQLFDHTVFGYIRKLRMEHALLLLKNTANTVDEVAYLLGYENSNHFSVAFKKYFGSSPSVYLRKPSRISISSI
jgi:AraC family transcriptional regulator, transcriptional activator of the genes for pyochelin and ferripyochelin receptors